MGSMKKQRLLSESFQRNENGGGFCEQTFAFHGRAMVGVVPSKFPPRENEGWLSFPFQDSAEKFENYSKKDENHNDWSDGNWTEEETLQDEKGTPASCVA